jgi:hypothetical protein
MENRMELNKIMISVKWLLLFLVVTVCAYLSFYTTQPHYHISLNNLSFMPSLSSIDPGIAVVSIVTSILLTAITYHELKKRSNKSQTKENT